MDVSVVIINYNTASVTLQCIESIYKYSNNLEIEIIIVDNNSSDNSLDLIKRTFSKVIVISIKKILDLVRPITLVLHSKR